MGKKFRPIRDWPVDRCPFQSLPVPGRSGFGPQLSLSYDSGAGNGTFGFGWNLSLSHDHQEDR
jgi:hypothetical protein